MKVRGGVLMATGVVEAQLQKDAIVAACITDPLHVEGGGCVVLELQWHGVWSLRDSLQQASFLRMPIRFMCCLPRNASTGKVQKELVQAALARECEAEAAEAEELRATQRAQLAWYASLTKPFIFACVAQPLSLATFCLGFWRLDASAAASGAVGFLGHTAARLSLVAWCYGAIAHAARFSVVEAGGATLLAAAICAAVGCTRASVFGGVLLLSAVVAVGWAEEAVGQDGKGGSKAWSAVRGHLGRLGIVVFMASLPGMVGSQELLLCFSIGLWLLFALGRRLPAAETAEQGRVAFALQRVAAMLCSLVETPAYLAGLVVMFALCLPSIVLAQYPRFAWARMVRPGKPLPRGDRAGRPFSGPRRHLSKLHSGTQSDGCVWVDLKAGEGQDEGMAPENSDRAVQAETPAGERALVLARQAGVDFHSVDSLRIARLSVLMKKNLRQKPGAEPLEFRELREACASKACFVSLVDRSMELPSEEDREPVASAFAARSIIRDLWRGLSSWVRGGVEVHREGATQAPWGCQVDVLLEWKRPAPLDPEVLGRAYLRTKQLHPMLRARPPPDDNQDAAMGDISTTAVATWNLVCAVWSTHASWMWRCSVLVREVVAQALWLSWPRTLLVASDRLRQTAIPMYSKTSDGWHPSPADEVYELLGHNWNSWFDNGSAVNICLVTLITGDISQQFLYCSMTHKYADGGAAAAFVHSLGECYDACECYNACRDGLSAPPTSVESPILALQQRRLRRYLSGKACPQGSMDAYFFDTHNDSFSHASGHSVGTLFSDAVCGALRVVGLRLACSEEIAWLCCITCALGRLLPEEKVLKILIVHNGRMGDAEGSVACVSQYVMLSIPCANERSNTPLADVASQVKFAVTSGKWTRPAPCEQSHAKINIGGMVGSDGFFSQVFKKHRPKKSSWSKAPHVLQLRMDNEGGIWQVKDFKCHQHLDPRVFWEAVVCAALEIADGWFADALGC